MILAAEYHMYPYKPAGASLISMNQTLADGGESGGGGEKGKGSARRNSTHRDMSQPRRAPQKKEVLL